MLKDMVSYTDIDGQQATKTVFFNLTQFEIEGEMELETLQARFQRFQDEVIGNDAEQPKRPMTSPEKRELLGMIKEIIRHAYGRKEGKRFIKTDEVWDEFEQTGAFSAYVYQLFLQEGAANRFMAGIWPQGVDRQTPDGSALGSAPDGNGATDGPVTDANWHYSAFSREQLLAMSDEDFDAVKDASIQGRNVPLPLLQIQGQRQAGKGTAAGN